MPFEKELYQRIDEVMHYLWDPIGVSGVPQARDEYDNYLVHLLGMLLRYEDQQSISAYLNKVEGEYMGLTPNKDKADEVADVLIRWRDALKEKYSNNIA